MGKSFLIGVVGVIIALIALFCKVGFADSLEVIAIIIAILGLSFEFVARRHTSSH